MSLYNNHNLVPDSQIEENDFSLYPLVKYEQIHNELDPTST
jgi:hypothetical protein